MARARERVQNGDERAALRDLWWLRNHRRNEKDTMAAVLILAEELGQRTTGGRREEAVLIASDARRAVSLPGADASRPGLPEIHRGRHPAFIGACVGFALGLIPFVGLTAWIGSLGGFADGEPAGGVFLVLLLFGWLVLVIVGSVVGEVVAWIRSSREPR